MVHLFVSASHNRSKMFPVFITVEDDEEVEDADASFVSGDVVAILPLNWCWYNPMSRKYSLLSNEKRTTELLALPSFLFFSSDFLFLTSGMQPSLRIVQNANSYTASNKLEVGKTQ